MIDLEFKLDDVIRGREWKTSPLAQTFDTLTERLRMLEDARRRLLTNLVDVDGVELRAGLEVEVDFEHHADDEGSVWLPVFRPARPA